MRRSIGVENGVDPIGVALELVKFLRLVVVHVIDANRVVVAAGRHEEATGAEREAQHLAAWTALFDEFFRLRIEMECLGAPLPEADEAVVAGRGEPARVAFAVGRELDVRDGRCVTLKHCCRLGCAQIPDADHLVAAA